uniref:Uncharacterized protein n=1 Tax=Arundo donax TaxID=35708 RepID=A0A0A9G1V1_ARUDO
MITEQSSCLYGWIRSFRAGSGRRWRRGRWRRGPRRGWCGRGWRRRWSGSCRRR